MDVNHKKITDRQIGVETLLFSFRTLYVLLMLLVFVWVGFSITHYYQTRRLIHSLFARETQEMGSLLAVSERAMSRIASRLESEQADRLLAVGFWLRDLEMHHSLTDDDLDQAVESTRIFNLVVFDANGRRELGFRGGAPRWAGGGGRGQFHAPAVEQFLQKNVPYAIEGLHPSGGFGGDRFSVLVRRRNGGAIMINIDAQAQEELINQFGPTALIAEFVAKPNIRYALRMKQGRVEEQYGDKSRNANDSAFQVELPLSETENEILVIGFDDQPLVENNRILLHRMFLSIGVACSLGLFIFAGSRLHKRYLQQSLVLRRLKSYHRTVLDTMQEAVIAWDERSRLTFWNPKAEKLFTELARRPALEYVPDSIVAICDGAPLFSPQQVIEFQEDDREIRRYRAEVVVIADPLSTRVLFLSDVTDVENSIREHDRREHVEALAKVASGVAHEVRNPLNTIDMSIQTLCMEPSTLHPNDKAVLESLREEIQRINAMVEHFLAYGRPPQPFFSEIDLNILVNDAAAFIKPSLQEKNLRLSSDLFSSACVQADAQQVKQALLNVVLNAIDASSEGMEILIQTEDREPFIVCRCRDYGIGMTPQQIQTIFDPYVTSKPKGTGLGMSIVKRIMDSHGGEIKIQSSPGEGTTIELLFSKSFRL